MKKETQVPESLANLVEMHGTNLCRRGASFLVFIAGFVA
jgi:hypothetical protein